MSAKSDKGHSLWLRRLTVNIPSANTAQRTIFLLIANCDCRKTGMGIAMIIMSDDMFRTALVIIWFVSAEQFTEYLS